MYYKSSFLTLIVVFSTIFILSCDNKKISVSDISVTEEGFTFEIEGDNSFCKKINEFKIFSTDNSTTLIVFFDQIPRYIETIKTDKGIKLFWNYKDFIKDDEYWNSWGVHKSEIIEKMSLDYNQEYYFIFSNSQGKNVIVKFYLKNKIEKERRKINFEDINPSDYEIQIFENIGD